MRNKKEFIFNEKEYAEKIIEEGFENGILDYSKIYTVAKYFREQYGYGEKRLEKEIIEFCQKHDKNFNPVVEAGAIHKWVKSAMNYGLRKIEEVEISKKDIEFLKTIKATRDRKALFVTLIFSKSLKQASTKRKKREQKESPNFYVHYNNLLDITRLSKISGLTELGLIKIYHKHPGAITFLHPERELLRIDFIDKEPKEIYLIDDLDNIMGFYEKIFGKLYEKGEFPCTLCGKISIKKANNQKVCTSCSKEIKKEQSRARKVKWREKNKKSRNL